MQPPTPCLRCGGTRCRCDAPPLDPFGEPTLADAVDPFVETTRTEPIAMRPKGGVVVEAVDVFDELTTKNLRIPKLLDAWEDPFDDSRPTSPFDQDEPEDPWIAAATTGSFRLDKLLGGSDADAVVLGDPTDVTGSIEIEIVDPDGASVVRQINLGGDLERSLGRDVVLARTEQLPSAAALSPFERFVLARIDGVRSIDAIRDEMGVSENDLRIALALLLDKRLLRPLSARLSAETTRETADVATAKQSAVTHPESLSLVVGQALFPSTEGAATIVGQPVSALLRPLSVVVGDPLEGPPSSAPPSPFPSPPASTSSPAPSLPPASDPPRRSAAAIRGAAPRAPLGPEGAASSTPSTTPSAAPATAHTKAADLYERARRAVRNGAFDDARAFLAQAIELSPFTEVYQRASEHWDAFVAANEMPKDQRQIAMAVRAEHLGDLSGAIGHLQQATWTNPDNATAWNRLGLLLARTKDTAGAIAALRRAAELAPHDVAIVSNLTKLAATAEHHDDKGLKALVKGLLRPR